MDNLLDNAPCGFLVFADNGKITEINTTLLELLGYEYNELYSQHIEKILSVAGRIFYQTHFFPLLKIQNRVDEVYLSVRSRSGRDIPVLVNAARHLRGGQNFNDCILVVVSRRNQFEEEILLAKKKAEAATRSKDEYLTHVSHELRTLLNAIVGWAQMLQKVKTSDAQVFIHAIEVIVQNARIQTQLIEDILDFSRIVSGKLNLVVEEIDPRKIIEAAVDTVIPAASAKQITIDIKLDSDIIIPANPRRLQQVVWNLLSNSVKFTPEGGKIKIKLMRRDSDVEISVSDTGKGISADFIPYIFERFQQEESLPGDRASGLGLGLAITQQIVELHRGIIRAESRGENLGATFTVTLPTAAARDINQKSNAAPRRRK